MTTQHQPYRMVSGGPRFKFRYLPCFGLAPIVAVFAICVPIAWFLRSDGQTASTLTCSTANETEYTSPCMVHDARSVRAFDPIACTDTPAALEAMLDSRNPLSRPFVTASVVEMPAPADTMIVPAQGVYANGEQLAVIRKTKHAAKDTATALPKPVADPQGGIAPNDARTLLTACVENAGKAGRVQTVSFAILDRNYLKSAIALGVGFLFALLFSLRRRVEVVGVQGRVEVTERGFFLVKRRASFTRGEADRVLVTSGASGPFVGARVEIMRPDGERIPLTETFAPFTTRKQTRIAAGLLSRLGAPA